MGKEGAAWTDHLDEPLDHLLGCAKIGDHPVLEGPYGDDVLMGLFVHLHGPATDGDGFLALAVHGYDAGLVDDDLPVLNDECICRPQIDGKLLLE